MKQIIITIDPTGGTKIETKGYTGPSCKAGSRWLEEALGQRVKETLTPDFHKAPEAQQVKQ